MKSISLKDLKENLSEYTEEAAQGTPIQVTKYNKPFIYLMAVKSSSLHVGKNAGEAALKSVGKSVSDGEFLTVLKADREER